MATTMNHDCTRCGRTFGMATRHSGIDDSGSRIEFYGPVYPGQVAPVAETFDARPLGLDPTNWICGDCLDDLHHDRLVAANRDSAGRPIYSIERDSIERDLYRISLPD